MGRIEDMSLNVLAWQVPWFPNTNPLNVVCQRAAPWKDFIRHHREALESDEVMVTIAGL